MRGHLSPAVALALALLLAGIAAGLAAVGGAAVSLGNLAAQGDPLLLPGILIGLWIALAGLILWREAARAPAREAGARKALAVIAASLASAALIAPIGMFLALALATPLVLWLCGERTAWRLIAVSAALGPGLWFLFHHVFLIRLPSLLSGGAI